MVHRQQREAFSQERLKQLRERSARLGRQTSLRVSQLKQHGLGAREKVFRQVGTARTRWQRPASPGLTVLLPITDPARAAITLRFLHRSATSEVEILVADCRPVSVRTPLRLGQAAMDPRIRVLDEKFDSIAPGVNSLVAQTRSDYLAIASEGISGDRQAYRRLLAAAQRNNADMVIAQCQRSTIAGAATIVIGALDAVTDPAATTGPHEWTIFNRIVCTELWREQVGALAPTTSPYIDPLMRLYVSAQRITTLNRTAFVAFPREPFFGQLEQGERRMIMAGSVLRRQDHTQRFVLERAGMTLIRWALLRDDRTRAAVASILRAAWDETPAAGRRECYARGRIMSYLASRSRWDDADRVDSYFQQTHARPPAVVQRDASPSGGSTTFCYDLSGMPGAPVELPQDVVEVGPREAAQVAEIHTAQWTSRHTLTLTGWTYLRGISGARGVDAATITAWLQQPDGTRAELDVRQLRQPWANRRAQEPFADYRDSGFALDIDTSSITRTATLHLGLTVQGWHVETVAQQFSHDGNARLLLRAKKNGVIKIPSTPSTTQPPDNGPQLDDITLDSTKLHLKVRGLGENSFVLRGQHTNVAGTVELADGGPDVVTFDLSAPDSFGTARLLPPGALRLDPRITASDALIAALPIRYVNDTLAVQVQIDPDRTAGIDVAAPLRLDELGVSDQQRLRTGYRTEPVTPIDAVLFQCYQGEFAADSQLAIFHEIRRRRPDAACFWSVSSYATALPDGAIPVVIGTREWYEVLAAVRYICHNTHFESFFVKRGHQKLLQTFHGYPVKKMGRAYMRQTGDYTPRRIQENIDRHNREWDAITVPSDLVAEICRTEYEFTGRLLMTGYPRNDAVLAANAEQVRQATRSALGIDEGITTILYAPTWRETLKISGGHSQIYRGLDLARLRRALGENYVILARGHDYNLRAGETFDNADGIIDVTAYPDVNDLILAGDLALLDYSSLRFDWALTGKPMVFFIPDYEDYLDMRGFLIPFKPTAPGPQVDNVDDLATALAAMRQNPGDYASQITEFNARYNPLASGHAAQRVVDEFFADFVGDTGYRVMSG